MEFRKVFFAIASIFLIAAFSITDSAIAAESHNCTKSKTERTAKKQVDDFTLVINTGFSHCIIIFDRSSGSHSQKKARGVDRSTDLPIDSRSVGAILDYDDYTHIFRIYMQ